MKRLKLNLRVMLIMFTLIPLVIGIVALAVVSVNLMKSNLEETTFEELKVAAQGLKSYYEYDLVNDNALVDGFLEYNPEEYIDVVFGNTGVNLTLFKDDVRFMTSLRNADGSRNEGTNASAEVWADVKTGKDFQSNTVVIGGKDYFVYYMPLLNGEGQVVGMSFAGKPATQIQEAESHILMLVGIISAALIVLFTVLAMILAKKVANPIKEVADKLKELSEGETNVELTQSSHIAETVVLRDSLLTLGDRLHNTVETIQKSMSGLGEKIEGTNANAAQVSDDMQQISGSMNGLAQSNVMLAENVQDINTNAMDMGDMVGAAINAVSEMKESSANMTSANENALRCINNIVESSHTSVEAVNDIAESITNTSEAIKKINDMVTMITSIASQTNLLSLNASIEAARAGEEGRGFAVVAGEIGKLAQQSDELANEIKSIVGEISRLSDDCVKQAEVVKGIIEEQQKLLDEASGEFETLSSEITGSVSNIDKISGITDKLGDIKVTVLNAVNDLSAVSEETSATNQEVLATTETITGSVESVSTDMSTMKGMADELKEAVDFFKI